MNTEQPVSASSPARASGILLISSTALAVVFMAHHPTSGTHDAAVFAERAARGIAGLSLVHGVLIVVLLLMTTGFVSIIDVVSHRRLLARLALTSLIVGAASGTIAALINGFILPITAGQFAGETAEALAPLLALCLNANSVLARVCVLGLSTHAALCGVGLLPSRGMPRLAGVAGVCCGLLSPLLLLVGSLPMNVSGFGSFVVINGVWTITAGLTLIGSRRSATTATW